jgi:hypothetical protein
MKWYQLALEKHDHVNDISETYHVDATKHMGEN